MKPIDTSKLKQKVLKLAILQRPLRKEAAELIENSVKEINAEAFKAAATLLEKSLALDPSNIKALHNALVHVELNKMEDGIEFASRLSGLALLSILRSFISCWDSLSKSRTSQRG